MVALGLLPHYHVSARRVVANATDDQQFGNWPSTRPGTDETQLLRNRGNALQSLWYHTSEHAAFT